MTCTWSSFLCVVYPIPLSLRSLLSLLTRSARTENLIVRVGSHGHLWIKIQCTCCEFNFTSVQQKVRLNYVCVSRDFVLVQ